MCTLRCHGRRFVYSVCLSARCHRGKDLRGYQIFTLSRRCGTSQDGCLWCFVVSMVCLLGVYGGVYASVLMVVFLV